MLQLSRVCHGLRPGNDKSLWLRGLTRTTHGCASSRSMDQTPGDARRLIADYAAVGVNRIVVGLVDLTMQN